jgi:hypothetical protein
VAVDGGGLEQLYAVNVAALHLGRWMLAMSKWPRWFHDHVYVTVLTLMAILLMLLLLAKKSLVALNPNCSHPSRIDPNSSLTLVMLHYLLLLLLMKTMMAERKCASISIPSLQLYQYALPHTDACCIVCCLALSQYCW